MTATMTATRESRGTRTQRAVGVVRVSERKGREGDSFASPDEQRERIEAACERDGLALAEVHSEVDVSGGKPLAQRPGLLAAVEAVEAGHADVVVVAYFDRLVRSVVVQAEAVGRIEAAGGRVLALDVGAVTETGSAAQWLSGAMLGAVAEYQRRSTGERSRAAQVRAVERGVLPWPNVPPGYDRGPDGVLVPNADAGTVRQAFELRAEGATIADVRTFLSERGVERTYHGVQALLASEVVLGRIVFGTLRNDAAHPAIVPTDLWKRVQRVKVPRGRQARSERLLARLGVLRCATCGARMVVGSAHFGEYALYRCPPTSDCPRRVTVGAELVEGVVVDAVRALLADAQGRASTEDHARDAERAHDDAQASLDRAVAGFAEAGLSAEPSAVKALGDLRQARDDALDALEALGPSSRSVTVGMADWPALTLSERRDLIRATVVRVEVAPGRGAARITVEMVA